MARFFGDNFDHKMASKYTPPSPLRGQPVKASNEPPLAAFSVGQARPYRIPPNFEKFTGFLSTERKTPNLKMLRSD